jgi:altronate hydrolase
MTDRSTLTSFGMGPKVNAVSVRAIKIDPRDNVAVVVVDVQPDDRIRLEDGTELTAAGLIPRGNKVALDAIAPGEPVVRYGEEIGVALVAIAAGDHVHTHNLGGRK